MTTVCFGRTVDLITDKSGSSAFKLGLEAIQGGTGRRLTDVTTDYDGTGISFESGDVLFGKLRPYLAKSWLADRNGEAVGDFHVYRPRPSLADGRYLHYVTLSSAFLDPVVSSVFGAKMPRASWDFIRNVEVHLPPLPEQRAIADYLDRETAQIDTLIAKQQRLIDFLSELYDADLFRLLANDPSRIGHPEPADLYGVGALTRSWDAVAIQRLGAIGSGSGFPPSEQGRTDAEHGFFKVKHLGHVGPDLSMPVPEDSVTEETRRRLGAQLFPVGTIAFAKVGAALMLGRMGILREPACMDNNMAGFVPTDDHSPDYLALVLSLLDFELLANPGAVPSLDMRALKACKLPIPPRARQDALIGKVHLQTAKRDRLVDKATNFIDLARERRAALITAAVTGQIDVRTAA